MNEGLLEAAERALPILENELECTLDFCCDRDDALELDCATLDASSIDHVAELSNLIAFMRAEIERARARKRLDAAIKAVGALPLTPGTTFRRSPADARAHVAKRIRGGADSQFRLNDRWHGVIPLVEQILADEGAAVTFTGPNPDFNGLPNEAVGVTQAPSWFEKTYRADTLADCLRAAITDHQADTALARLQFLDELGGEA